MPRLSCLHVTITLVCLYVSICSTINGIVMFRAICTLDLSRYLQQQCFERYQPSKELRAMMNLTSFRDHQHELEFQRALRWVRVDLELPFVSFHCDTGLAIAELIAKHGTPFILRHWHDKYGGNVQGWFYKDSDGLYGRRWSHTPLHIAAVHNTADFLEVLLAMLPRSSLERKWGGETPLHDATCLGSKDNVRVLLHHGANPNTRGNMPWSDRPHKSACEYAVYFRSQDSEEFLDMMIEAGCVMAPGEPYYEQWLYGLGRVQERRRKQEINQSSSNAW